MDEGKYSVGLFNYFKLTDTALEYFAQSLIHTYSIKYSDIKSVSFSKGMGLFGNLCIDAGAITPYYWYRGDREKFLKELSEKYKKNTGKDLVIINK